MMYFFKKLNRRSIRNSHEAGDILLSVIVFAAIAITMTIGLVNWGASLLKTIRLMEAREQALQIAEAGIDYYRWHLAHSPTDYTDGPNNGVGPYIHTVADKDGTVIGSYSLTITAPPNGSTLTTIVSKGTLVSNPTVARTIKVTMAIPSWAQYAVVANDNMFFGSQTEVYGPIHSNYGIHFDGVSHGPVTSSVSSYLDPDYNQTKFGVYTLTPPSDPNPPSAVPSRPDVFMAGRTFPVPVVDFTALTSVFSQLKSLAVANGVFLAKSQYGGSSASGYHIVLKTNGTYDLFIVTSLVAPPSGCSNSAGQVQWGTWSIQNQVFVQNYALPSNGIIYAEDNVWVDGQVHGGRVTIAAGVLPDPGSSQQPNITINSDLLYSAQDGTDSIGLVAQGNINVGLNSSDSLTVDAALIAQNGRVGRYYYSASCGSDSTQTSVTLFGMIATNKRYGFAYSNGTGYTTRNIRYDVNLLYSPPPSFPLNSSQYQTLSWQEIN